MDVRNRLDVFSFLLSRLPVLLIHMLSCCPRYLPYRIMLHYCYQTTSDEHNSRYARGSTFNVQTADAGTGSSHLHAVQRWVLPACICQTEADTLIMYGPPTLFRVPSTTCDSDTSGPQP